ncbi:MAG: ADP-ribose pyrophosphatase [Dehalococcoidia bacterium]|nr:ADP-ribose pyrophosphatase [Dehalococcoidia bacterium]
MTENLNEETLNTERPYSGKIVNLRVDTIKLPSGRVVTREVVEHCDSVCMVPVDNEHNIWFVRQFRTPAGRALLELPAGGIDDGELASDAALRELQEEIGCTATDLKHLASFFLAPGWCNEYMHAYLATGLIPSKLEADDDENIQIEKIPLKEVSTLIQNGDIDDVKTIAGLLLATQVLGDN